MTCFKWHPAIICLAACEIFFHSLRAANSQMIVDLGFASRFVQVTPEYRDAAVSAILPRCSEVAKKLNLPVPNPITRADIAEIHFLPFLTKTFSNPSVSILLTNGWAFTYQNGYVSQIADSHAYSLLQNPSAIPKYYGEVKMTEDEAVQLARNSLKRLNIPLEDVYADQKPKVTLPERIGTNTVPQYEIEWIDPRGGVGVVDFHINANTKRVERMRLSCKSLERPAPKLNVTPTPSPLDWPPVNPEYAHRLIPMMFKSINDYIQKLSLPVPTPLTTNNVARVEIVDNGGWPHAEVTLTNSWRFIYRHAMVNGYYSSHVLLTDIHNRPIHIKDFEGKWNLTTNQAIELVKMTLAKLNFPTNNIHMDFPPNIICAAGDFKKTIPRLFFEWNYENAAHDDLQSKVEAEVNADNGKLESLYYDDKAYWQSRPPIDVPIAVKK